MPRIQIPQLDRPASRLDKVIGSDLDNASVTRNYQLGDILALFNSLSGGGVYAYKYKASLTAFNTYTGIMATLSGTTNPDSVATFRFSTKDISDVDLTTLVTNYNSNSDDVVMRLTSEEDSNLIAVYRITGVTSNATYVDVDVLQHKSFNSLTFIQDKNFTLSFDYVNVLGGNSGGVTNTSELTNDGADGVNPFITSASLVTDHTALSNIGTNTHVQIDNHIADSTLHYTQASISITESQISDLQSYLLSTDIDTFAELQAIVADETLVKSGDNISLFTNDSGYITSSALSGYVQTTDIDTFAELQAIVADETLVKSGDNISLFTNDSGYITATLTDEEVQDLAGAMVTGNTETLITVTYIGFDNTLDFVVENDLSLYDNTTSGFLVSADIDTFAELDAIVADESLLKSTGTPVANQIAIWNNANTLEGRGDMTLTATTFSLDVAEFGNSTLSLDTSGNVSMYGATSMILKSDDFQYKDVTNVTIFSIGSGGNLAASQYGIGTFTGVEAYLLSVTAGGAIIETPLTDFATPTDLTNYLLNTTDTFTGVLVVDGDIQLTADDKIQFSSEFAYIYEDNANSLGNGSNEIYFGSEEGGFHFIEGETIDYREVTASAFITDGGASTDFTKGDGSLDSNEYLVGREEAFNLFGGATAGENVTIAGGNTGFGVNAMQNDTSEINNSAFGHEAMKENAGHRTNAFGLWAGKRNTANDGNFFGQESGQFNQGLRASGFGGETLQFNIGDDSLGFGNEAGLYNEGDKNTGLGASSLGFVADVGSLVSFVALDVTAGTNRITITGHGLGANGTYRNLLYEGVTGGITDNTVYGFQIIDANTIEILEDSAHNLDGTEVGDLTPQTVYTNVTTVGYNSQPTASNQVVLGDTNVTTVLTTGDITANSFITDGGASTQVVLGDGTLALLTSLSVGDADTLDTLDSSQFLRSDVADIKTAGNLTFNNSVTARFGTSFNSDMDLYHTGSNGYLDIRAGDLYIRNGTTQIYRFSKTSGYTYFGSDGVAETHLVMYSDTAGKTLQTSVAGTYVTQNAGNQTFNAIANQFIWYDENVVEVGRIDTNGDLDIVGNVEAVAFKTDGGTVNDAVLGTGALASLESGLLYPYKETLAIASSAPTAWYKIYDGSAALEKIKFYVEAPGDNGDCHQEFTVTLAGYSFDHHIIDFGGGRYNTPKILAIRTTKATSTTPEVWIELDAYTVGNTLTVWSSHSLPTLATGTPDEVTNASDLAYLDFDATIRDTTTLSTSGAMRAEAHVTEGGASTQVVLGDGTLGTLSTILSGYLLNTTDTFTGVLTVDAPSSGTGLVIQTDDGTVTPWTKYVNTSGLDVYARTQSGTYQMYNDALALKTLSLTQAGVLTIADDVSAGGDLIMNTNATYLKAAVSSSSQTRIHGINASDIEYIGAIDQNVVGTFVGTTTDYLALRTDSTTAIHIDNSQNVAIGGHSTPLTKLEVYENNAPSIITIKGGLNTEVSIGGEIGSLDFRSNDASILSTNDIAARIVAVNEWTNGAYAGLAFYTADNTTPPYINERMRITWEGDVGIGTTTPSEALDVVGSITSSATVRTGVYTVAGLPAGTQGDRAMVTDANATTFLSTVAGGGANVVPVSYDGTNWVIG